MWKVSSGVQHAPLYFNFAADVIDRWAKRRPDGLALWCAKSGSEASQKYTFSQISELSHGAAGFFARCGIQKGDRVLIMLPRVVHWWTSMLGLIRLGAVPVPATLLLTPREVQYRIETARIKATITSSDGVTKLQGFDGVRVFVGAGGPLKAESAPDGWLDFDRELAEANRLLHAVKTRSDEPAGLYFTSATTGEPKMVLHTQASYGLGHALTGQHWLDLRADDIHWNISDLGWAKAAWSSFFGPWLMGACIFALDVTGKFDPALTLDTLSEYPITSWCAPPTALRLMVRQNLANWKFPRLRHCVTAGEPLNPEVLNIWRNATGLTLYEGYGQTETVVLVANCRSRGDQVIAGSMGKAVPGLNIGLLDQDLKEVPVGHEGQIALRVKPQRPLGLFREYWLNEKETKGKFYGDWYLTGDQATCDAEGHYWFIGRNDDVIKSSGYRIGPFEVESALLEHPAVLEVAVIGKPDALRGQIVKAYVVLRQGMTPASELETELQMHCKRLIAAFKHPREIEFVRELPRTTSGKTRHVQLRQAAATGP